MPVIGEEKTRLEDFVAAVHVCELRTMLQGHPDYRFIAQEMWHFEPR